MLYWLFKVLEGGDYVPGLNLLNYFLKLRHANL